MVETFIKHKVENYDKWKSVYDEFLPKAETKGVKAQHVFHDLETPDTVIVTHEFDSLKSAKEFFGSGDLRSAMDKAGVSSAPEIWYGEEVH